MSTDTENEIQQVTAELAKPEDITEFVAEREEQEEADRPAADEHETLVKDVREKHPELKQRSRYARLKAGRERLKQENQELRAQLGQRDTPADTDSPTGDPEAFDSGSTDYNTAPADPEAHAALTV